MVIDSEIGKRLCVSGGDPEIAESPSEPQWSPKGTNFFFMIYILQLAAQAFFVWVKLFWTPFEPHVFWRLTSSISILIKVNNHCMFLL